MKYIWLLFTILFLGCHNSAESSFQSLNQAFINWYYKYHPVEATRFGIEKYNEGFRLMGITEHEEYMADISRFTIELSQIDVTKLPLEERVEYHILYSQLEKMKYIMTDMRPWEWDPLWVLDEISEGLFLLSERPGINMNKRVESAQERLYIMPSMLNLSREMMLAHSSLNLEYANDRIEQINYLMEQLPIKLNSDNLTLDEIDKSITACKKTLLEYQEWINHDAIHLPLIQIPQDLKLIDKGFPYLIGKNYLPDHIYELAEKELFSTQNNLFDLCLPIYLIENDEPIWLDRDDTLEVVRWTIRHIDNKPMNQVSTSSVLSHFYESISSLENYSKTKGLIPGNVKKKIKLTTFPINYQAGSVVHLFDYQPKNIHSDILYYVQQQENADNLFSLTSQKIDLVNAMNIIPGHSVQIAHAQKNPYSIRYIFPDPINEAGWQNYALQMIIDEGFGGSEGIYHILSLKEQVRVACQTFIEGKYYAGKMNRKEAINYLRKKAFINIVEAENFIVQSELNYFSGTKAFIGTIEINSIYNEYKKNLGDKFQISQFHQKILEKGIIPFNQLKKQILTQ